MGKPHTQGVTILINDNIIEQVTDFRYLGYRISEYKNDLEDKLQTYNKINGAIRRHFGKQMNKETKLRIHNITAKAALRFGSEAWVLKKREEQRLEAAQMEFLRHLLGITKLDKGKNQCIREKKGSTEHSKGNKTLDFKLSPSFESCMYSFGYFPGVQLWFADVSEPSISSIFKGWM